MAYIQVARFKLRDGVTDEAFMEAERAIRDGRIRQQPGYLGRETARGEDGEWLVLIRWETKENSEAWSPIFRQDPDGQTFAGCLDFTTMHQDHYTLVSV